MKLIILLCSLAAVHGAPARVVFRSRPKDTGTVQLLRYENYNDGHGIYKFSFALSDNTRRREEWEVINAGTPDEEVIVSGEYSYIGPDGELYNVSYTADKNGFHPEGEHLPRLPEDIWNDELTPARRVSSALIASLLG